MTYKEMDFEGIYRGEKIPINTINKLNEKKEGFLINQILYEDMIDGLGIENINKAENKIIYILNNLDKNKFGNGTIDLSQDILLEIKNKKQDSGFRHKRSIIMKIKNKKYFLKIICPLDKPNCDINGNLIPASNEYQALEYIYKNYPNINLIKPILSYDNEKNHIIIYPNIENMQILSDIYDKYGEQEYNRIMLKNLEIDILKKDKKINDVYSKNMRVNNDKIYIFDPIYIDSDDIYNI